MSSTPVRNAQRWHERRGRNDVEYRTVDASRPKELGIRGAIISAINSDARCRTRPWCKIADPDHRLDQGRLICTYCTRSGV